MIGAESRAPEPLDLVLPDTDATERLGAALAAALTGGDVVCLDGPLGAGKSTLARAIVRARLAEDGRAEDVPSPTYTLTQTYETRRGPILHADLYRLGDAEEALELGLGEPDPDAVWLIEWAERLGRLLPPRRLRLALGLPARGEPAELRRLAATARDAGAGESWARAVAALRRSEA